MTNPADPFNLWGIWQANLQESLRQSQKMNDAWRNHAEYWLTGGLKVDEVHSPYAADLRDQYTLRHYFPDEAPEGLPALLLVPPLMMAADLYDVAPRSSSVNAVHDLGIDVWVVDFRRPEEEDGGLERSVSDYVLSVDDAIDAVRAATGRDVVLGGYSQGGMFCYQVAAYRQGRGIDSIVAFGTPVDFSEGSLPVPISMDAIKSISQGLLATGLPARMPLPAWLNRQATQMLDPIKGVEFQMAYLRQLHDREKILPGEQQRQFLSKKGWTAFSSAAFEDLLRDNFVTNRMAKGGIVIGDTVTSLADLRLPILTVVGEQDKEGHPVAVRVIHKVAPKADIYEVHINTGHFGIVAGGGARRNTWPRVAEWIRWRAGKCELGDEILTADEIVHTPGWAPNEFMKTLTQMTDYQVGMAKFWGSAMKEAGWPSGGAKAASLAQYLDLAASERRKVAVMAGGRALRQDALKQRLDVLAARLLAAGIKRGDRVGLMTGDRLAGFTALMALNRIGASAVMLRSGAGLVNEIAHATLSAIAVDSAALSVVSKVNELPVLLLSERAEGQSKANVVSLDDLPAELPAGFRANAASAEDEAFVLCLGKGKSSTLHPYSNQAWLRMADDAIKATALSTAETVYCATSQDELVNMLAIGAAVVSGARLALADHDGSDLN